MKHVYREDFTEEHDEMMREILREGGHPEAELEEVFLILHREAFFFIEHIRPKHPLLTACTLGLVGYA